MRNIKFHLAVLCLVLLTASTSTHVITGTPRSPIAPELVKIYSQPPENFEEITLLTASSRGSWAFTSQQKMNEVVDDLKKEAAKLGANGGLLQGFGDQKGDDVAYSTGQATTTGTGNTASTYGAGTTVISGTWHKTGWAVAIHVKPTND